MKKRYDMIYSLGYNCACAGWLRDYKLRKCSGPLDWVSGASLKERVKLVAADFENYLNEECLEKRDTINPDHDLYFDTRSKIFFVHDFPPGVPVAEVFPKVQAKYARRIARFYENIKNSKKTLLVYFSIQKDAPVVSREEIEESAQILSEKFPEFGKSIDFWVIQHDASVPKDEVRKEIIAPNTVFWTADIRYEEPRNDKEMLQGREEACRRIFKQIGLPLSSEIRLKFYKLLENVLCAFVFNKAKRRRVRDYLRHRFAEA